MSGVLEVSAAPDVYFLVESVAIHAWHKNVREYRIDRFAPEHFQGVDTIDGFDHVETFSLELGVEQFAVARNVIDNEDLHGFLWIELAFLARSPVPLGRSSRNIATWVGNLRVSIGFVM